MSGPGARGRLDGLLDLFFPPACVACDELLDAPEVFCEACAEVVEPIPEVRCGRCGEPGRFADAQCPACRASTPEYATAWAPFEHAGAVARAIHRFKYEDGAQLSRTLGRLLAHEGRSLWPRLPGDVCPIPLHAARFRERKYDQAALLAAELAGALGRPLRMDWLERVRETRQQVGLDERARADNVRGAFRASPAARGAAVLLVDDVLTTGATAREAARALLDAGAASVHVVTLARAVRGTP